MTRHEAAVADDEKQNDDAAHAAGKPRQPHHYYAALHNEITIICDLSSKLLIYISLTCKNISIPSHQAKTAFFSSR